MKIFTVGHSTRSFEEFVKTLKLYGITFLVDVRRFPSSTRFPWFGKESLEKKLPEEGFEYIHFPALGGYRKEGYAAFVQSEDFAKAVRELLRKIQNEKTAIMCAELVPFRCHRRYVAEALVALGYEVVHIYDQNKIQNHTLHTPEMRVKIFCDRVSSKP